MRIMMYSLASNGCAMGFLLIAGWIDCGLASTAKQIVFVLIRDRSLICVAHPSTVSLFQTALDIVDERIILFRH